MTRLIGFAIYCATCVLLVGMLFATIPGMEREYTTRYNAWQAGETARVQAREATERVQAEQWGATVQTWAWPAAIGAAAIVVAVQAGRTIRHRDTERTRQRALLLLYARQELPPGTRIGRGQGVEIIPWDGELALVDHSAEAIVPYSVAALTMAE